MRFLFFILVTSLTCGCVTYSRHSEFLADTNSKSIAGTCGSDKLQNSIEVKDSKVRIVARRFNEYGALFIVVIPIITDAADENVTFSFENMKGIADPKNYVESSRLMVNGSMLVPQVKEFSSSALAGEPPEKVYDAKFKLSSVKDVNEVELHLSELKGIAA